MLSAVGRGKGVEGIKAGRGVSVERGVGEDAGEALHHLIL